MKWDVFVLFFFPKKKKKVMQNFQNTISLKKNMLQKISLKLN